MTKKMPADGTAGTPSRECGKLSTCEAMVAHGPAPQESPMHRSTAGWIKGHTQVDLQPSSAVVSAAVFIRKQASPTRLRTDLSKQRQEYGALPKSKLYQGFADRETAHFPGNKPETVRNTNGQAMPF